MQKRLLLIGLMLLAAAMPVSAGNISISLIGDDFYLGQTVQAEVEMDNFAVTKLSLLGSSGNRLGASFFSVPYSDKKYFVYFNFPPSLEAGNYSLFASDRILEHGIVRILNATAPFPVKKSTAAFTLKPAIIKLSSASGSFRIELKHSYGAASDVEVSATDNALKPVRQSISISTGESKSLFVDYKELGSDAELLLKTENLSYSIPVIAFKEAASNETAANITETAESFENALMVIGNVSSITRKVKQDIVIAGPVSFKNAHAIPLHNLMFSASGVPGVEFNQSKVALLMPGETFVQHIWINRQKDALPGKYEGKINAESDEGAEVSIRLSIEFEAVEAPALPEKKKNITVAEAPAPLNISFNYSEVQQKTEEERTKSLKIAVVLIIAVVLLITLIVLKIRPRVKYKKMREYAKGAKR